VSDRASLLRERHWAKPVYSLIYDADSDNVHYGDVEVCNQDGQKWPCFTEQTIRETEPEG
jgi:hypothetical protein